MLRSLSMVVHFVSVAVCTDVAKVMVASTSVLGCDAFLSAQEEACVCTEVEGRNRRRKHEL
jgi:hypothetical protein